MKNDAYIGLGSNLGDRAAHLRAALEALEAHPAIQVCRVSDFYDTAPLAGRSQGPYLNAVACLETTLAPTDLLEKMHTIEADGGRVRAEPWQSRTIDLDLLLYGDQVIHTPALTVPHPAMHLRSFVLRGLCQVNAEAVHPVLKRTAAQLYSRLNGGDYYPDPARPQLISVAGLIGVGKTTLAARLAETLGATLLCEAYADNPYLPDVYAGCTDVALGSELFFLSSSATQLRRDRLENGRCCVSDYVFDKAKIYASSWLGARDLACYRKHYACVVKQIAAPVVVVYLTDDIQRCLERIHRRNRPYEQRIEARFLTDLKQKYDDLYDHWTVCPVIRIEASQCASPEQAAVWAEEIRHYITI